MRPWRRRRRLRWVLPAVALLHLGAAWLLARDAPRHREAVPEPPALLWLRSPAPPPAAPTRPPQRGPAPTAAATAAPSVATRRAINPAISAAPTPAVEPAAPPPAAPPADAAPATAAIPRDAAAPRLLDTEATRRALREAARGPSRSEQAASASAEPQPLRAEQRLGRDIARAAHGDCLQGEYAGGGMGLLSLPFWLAAEARGQCRH